MHALNNKCEKNVKKSAGEKFFKRTPRADLVENFANFQAYALAFSEKSKFFRLLLRGRPRMGAEQFDKVNVKLLQAGWPASAFSPP